MLLNEITLEIIAFFIIINFIFLTDFFTNHPSFQSDSWKSGCMRPAIICFKLRSQPSYNERNYLQGQTGGKLRETQSF